MVVITICFVASGCDKSRQDWPASIVAIEGFSEEQEEEVLSAVEDLNDEVGSELVSTDPKDDTYPITIILGPPEQEKATRVGLARVSSRSCSIELSKKLFDGTHPDHLKSVVWHELGHCKGLLHTTKEKGDVMSANALSFSLYTAEDILAFIDDLLFI